MRLPNVLAACCALLLAQTQAQSSDRWTTHSFTRQVDLGAGLTRISTNLLVERPASYSATDPTTAFKIAVPDAVHGNLSWLAAQVGKGASAREVPIAKAYHDLQLSATIYTVSIPVTAESNSSIILREVYSHLALPVPKYLEQAEMGGQHLLWRSDVLGGYGLLHDVQDAQVRVRLPTPRVKSIAPPQDGSFTHLHSAGSATVVFSSESGKVVPASPQLRMASVHYFQPEPVITFRNLKRLIQVSHWSKSVAFEDQIEMLNDGPILKGQFARIEHQKQAFVRRNGGAAPHVMAGLTLSLPPNIYSPYYVDTVGNVSTSRFRQSTVSNRPSILELRPRYPLLGGWTYNCTVGYIGPIADYLRFDRTTSEYLLKVPFVTAVKDIPVDSAEVRISLPESAQLISVDMPFVVDSMTYDTLYTYLDTTGRPTVVLKKTSVSDMHNLEVVIKYRYSLLALLQKPAAVATAILSVYLTVIFVRRLDWKISAKKVD